MKKVSALFGILVFLLALSPQLAAQNETTDYPLLSQGSFAPPPPPPGYAVTLPPMEPFTAPPAPPVLPPSVEPASVSADVPESARFNQTLAPASAVSGVRPVQIISPELAQQIARLVRSFKTYRTVIDSPDSDEQLRRILNTGKVCAELLGLQRFPAPSKFVVGPGDRVLRDRSHKAVEYRFYGDFDNRLNGWIKPIETAVYLDLVFDGRSRRRTHVRAQMTRTGPMTGYFYAYTWDAYGQQWKLQGSLDNIFVRDDGMPSGGDLKLFGADPSGRVMAVNLNFPVKILGEPEPEKKDTRHREGKRVSIGK